MVDRNQSLISQDNNLTLRQRDAEMAQAHICGMKAEVLVLNIADYVALRQIFSPSVTYHGWALASISNSMQFQSLY